MRLLFVATGDIYCSRDNLNVADKKILSIFNTADILFCNLEGPITSREAVRGPWPLRQSLKTVDILCNLGFNVVSFANNHALDCGIEGFLETLKLLEKSGIRYVGAGENIVQARCPAIIERKDVRIAFLAYASYFSPGDIATNEKPGIAAIKVDPLFPPPHIDSEDLETMKEDVKNAKNVADIVVVSHHWGGKFVSRNLAVHQRAIGHASIDAGADLVLGHHPHTLQGIEIYNGKIICYSLGNFIFDPLPSTGRVPDVFDDHWRESVILNCFISDNKKIEKAYLSPVFINEHGQTEMLNPKNEKFQRIFKMIAKLSKKFGTTLIKEKDKIWILK